MIVIIIFWTKNYLKLYAFLLTRVAFKKMYIIQFYTWILILLYISDINAAEDFIVELLDKTGERKFVKTKLDTHSNTFLSDKNTYIISQVFPS